MSPQPRTAPHPSSNTLQGPQATYRQHQAAMQAPQTQKASPEFSRLELRLVSPAIEKYCSYMQLDDAVSRQAVEILRQFVEETRYWTDRHAMIAGCIFIACRQCGVAMEYSAVCAAVGTPTVLGLAVLLAMENQSYRRNAEISRYKFRAMTAQDDCYMVTSPCGPSALIARAYNTSDPKLVDLLRTSQEMDLEVQPEVAGYKTRTVCRFLYLGDDVAVLAARIFKDFLGYYPDDAVIAASIFLACRECDKFLEHATILGLMGRRPSGMELSVLFEVEKMVYRDTRSGDDEKAVGRPEFTVVPRQMTSSEQQVPLSVWTIWPSGKEEVRIRADYSSRDPKIMDLWREPPKLEDLVTDKDLCEIGVPLSGKESMPSEEGDTASNTEWELVDHDDAELHANKNGRDMGVDNGALADTAKGSSRGCVVC